MAIPAMAVAAGISAIPQLFKGISGLFQIGKGNRLAKANKRPDYEIPQEFQQNLNVANSMAQNGLPQQQYNNALNNFNRNAGGALSVLRRGYNPAAGVASVLNATNNATLDLDMKDAMDKDSNMRNAMQYRSLMGQQRLAKWDWDKRQKYLENAQAAGAYQGAGRQNLAGAMDGLSQIGTTYIAGKQTNG